MRHALALVLSLFSTAALADTPLVDAVAGMDLFPCDLSSLSCTTLTVPLDHRANDPDKTLDITFALSFASVESRGILRLLVDRVQLGHADSLGYPTQRGATCAPAGGRPL